MNNEFQTILSQSYMFNLRERDRAMRFATENNMVVFMFDYPNYLVVPAQYVDAMLDGGYDIEINDRMAINS